MSLVVPSKRIRTGQLKMDPGPSDYIYVVLQRSSTHGPHGGKHDVSCVSIHTSLASANRAAKSFFEVDSEEDDLEWESGWNSWEDLDGMRFQTDEDGKMRIISRLGLTEETVVWVEKKIIEDEEEEEEEKTKGEGEAREDRHKKLKYQGKGESSSDVIDLTED